MFTFVCSAIELLSRTSVVLVTGVRISSEFVQPIKTRKAESRRKKGPHAFAHLVNFSYKCVGYVLWSKSLVILTIVETNFPHVLTFWSAFDSRINKPFTCSRCVICFSWSVRVISIYYVRKGLWAFCHNYPQIKEACLCTDIAFMLQKEAWYHTYCQTDWTGVLDTKWNSFRIEGRRHCQMQFHSLFVVECFEETRIQSKYLCFEVVVYFIYWTVTGRFTKKYI